MSIFTLRNLYILALLVLGGVRAYTARHQINVDAVSYLDVASAYQRHDWNLAISGYWSPVYSWILAIVMAITSPSSRNEYAVFTAVNLAGYLLSLFTFVKFWALLGKDERNVTSGRIPFAIGSPRLWDFLGFTVFFAFFGSLSSAGTPDVFASALIFSIATTALRTHPSHTSYRTSIWLGVLVGFAYLTKAILIYFGLVFLAVHFLRRRNTKHLLLSVSVVLLVIAPWILALHHKYGQYTLGLSGRMNYMWFVNGCPTGRLLELDKPDGTVTPFFPGPVIYSHPRIFKVETTPNVTYVPWFDPSRFDMARKPHFNLRQQLSALLLNLQWLREYFLIRYAALTLIPLCLILAEFGSAARNLRNTSDLLVPILFTITLYSLVFVRSDRYLAAFSSVLFAITIASARIPPGATKLAHAVVCGALVIFAATHVPSAIGLAIRPTPEGSKNQEIAEAIRRAGFKPQETVGAIGFYDYTYWARLAKMRLGTVILDKEIPAFWNASNEEQLNMLCVMKKSGVDVIVGEPPRPSLSKPWTHLGTANFWIVRPGDLGCPNL